MDVNELLNRPVSKKISDAVWEAHERQTAHEKARRLASEPVVARGRFSWSLAAGFQFFPEDPALGDKLVEKLQGRDWHIGVEGEITL